MYGAGDVICRGVLVDGSFGPVAVAHRTTTFLLPAASSIADCSSGNLHVVRFVSGFVSGH